MLKPIVRFLMLQQISVRQFVDHIQRHGKIFAEYTDSSSLPSIFIKLSPFCQLRNMDYVCSRAASFLSMRQRLGCIPMYILSASEVGQRLVPHIRVSP